VPKTPEVAYSLVKDLEEEMAVQFCRWDPEQKMIGLRFSNVMDPADYAEFPSFESDPASRKVEPVVVHRRPRRRPGGGEGARVRHAGLEAFVIAADDTVMSTPSAELMAQVFPEVESRTEVPGTAALCSLDKARRLLGWTPRHHWRDHVDAP
jgi:hypothetical protein